MTDTKRFFATVILALIIVVVIPGLCLGYGWLNAIR
jgi:hypothetical protein